MKILYLANILMDLEPLLRLGWKGYMAQNKNSGKTTKATPSPASLIFYTL